MHSQGLLAPVILVTKAELDSRDPDLLVDAVIRFCSWCIEEAGLVRDEVQPDAWLISHSSYYVSQVQNGGHGQFASNSNMNEEMLDDIEGGLARFEVEHLLAIFRRFRSELGRDDALRKAVLTGGGFGAIPEVINELDDAFHHSPDTARFHQKVAKWLRERPTVLAVNPRELQELQKAIVASNRLLASRRDASTSRSRWARLTDAAARLWDTTRFRRPGETVLAHAKRRVAANPPEAWQISDAQGDLIQQVIPAVRDANDEEVDRIFAGFRELHARYRLHTTERWPEHLRMYASKLLYAGEQLGRFDLLEQAADAFGRVIATGAIYEWDAGFDWRSLGQALVDLGRLDKSRIPGVAEAADAFTNALTIDLPVPDAGSRRLASLLGLAEAHLVLAVASAGTQHLEAARQALDDARPLVIHDDRCRWGALDAEHLLLMQPGQRHARERERILRQLRKAITWETENDGDPRANPHRLRRLHVLWDALAAGKSVGQPRTA
jgi:hypothetical protein